MTPRTGTRAYFPRRRPRKPPGTQSRMPPGSPAFRDSLGGASGCCRWRSGCASTVFRSPQNRTGGDSDELGAAVLAAGIMRADLVSGAASALPAGGCRSDVAMGRVARATPR